MNEREALQRAEELALRGRGDVEPNPVVGAVVLADGEIVGEGWHKAFGGPHAEIEALADAGGRARGATVCVTLEPCSTTGKTPPCTQALLAAGVARVVVGCIDPAPGHAGRGLDQLREAGVSVELVGSEVSAALIRGFASSLDRRRPHVLAKWAMSVEGAIAPADRERTQLSGPEAQALVHRWRASVDAVVVGVGTVLTDDPQLTARGDEPAWRPLRRVVFDPNLRTPPASMLVTTAMERPTWIVAAEEADQNAADALEAHGAQVLRVPGGPRFAEGALDVLALQGVARLMVEGGSFTLGRLMSAGLVDQVAAFLTPVFLGPGALPAVDGFSLGGLALTGGAGRRAEPQGAEPAWDAVARHTAQTLRLQDVRISRVGDDILLRGSRLAGGP